LFPMAPVLFRQAEFPSQALFLTVPVVF